MTLPTVLYAGVGTFVAQELLRIEPIEITGGHFAMLEDPEALADCWNV
ncbi:MAG: hypothetical protein ACJ752_04380 [Gaiellaceae bacterium]